MRDDVSPNQLALDLEELLDAGLVEFQDEPAVRVRQYKVTPLAKQLKTQCQVAGSVGPSSLSAGQLAFGYHQTEFGYHQTPCAHCGSDAGFDGGSRCRACHVPQPPYM